MADIVNFCNIFVKKGLHVIEFYGNILVTTYLRRESFRAFCFV